MVVLVVILEVRSFVGRLRLGRVGFLISWRFFGLGFGELNLGDDVGGGSGFFCMGREGGLGLS